MAQQLVRLGVEIEVFDRDGYVAANTRPAAMALLILLEGESRQEGEPSALLEHLVSGNPARWQRAVAEIRASVGAEGWIFLVD